jgi:hypothetical protein
MLIKCNFIVVIHALHGSKLKHNNRKQFKVHILHTQKLVSCNRKHKFVTSNFEKHIFSLFSKLSQ